MECKIETVCANIMSISKTIWGKQEFWKGFDRWTQINFQCIMLWINKSSLIFSLSSCWLRQELLKNTMHQRLSQPFSFVFHSWFSGISERTHVPRRPCSARFTKALTWYWIYNYGNYYWKPNLPFFSESAELLNFFSSFLYTTICWKFALLRRFV